MTDSSPDTASDNDSGSSQDSHSDESSTVVSETSQEPVSPDDFQLPVLDEQGFEIDNENTDSSNQLDSAVSEKDFQLSDFLVFNEMEEANLTVISDDVVSEHDFEPLQTETSNDKNGLEINGNVDDSDANEDSSDANEDNIELSETISNLFNIQQELDILIGGSGISSSSAAKNYQVPQNPKISPEDSDVISADDFEINISSVGKAKEPAENADSVVSENDFQMTESPEVDVVSADEFEPISYSDRLGLAEDKAELFDNAFGFSDLGQDPNAQFSDSGIALTADDAWWRTPHEIAFSRAGEIDDNSDTSSSSETVGLLRSE